MIKTTRLAPSTHDRSSTTRRGASVTSHSDTWANWFVFLSIVPLLAVATGLFSAVMARRTVPSSAVLPWSVLLAVLGVGLGMLRRMKVTQSTVLHELVYHGERFELAASSAEMGLWDWYNVSDGSCVWWSSPFRELLSDGDLTLGGWTFIRRLIHPTDESAFEQALQRMKETQGSLLVECRLKTAPNHYRWYRIRGQVVESTDGVARRAAGSIADIHEQKEQSHQLEAATEALRIAQRQTEHANRSKSEFLANMSHEIRTPMTAILGYAEVLAESLTTAELVDAAHTIKKNGDYLLKIINDILDLSKIEAGKLALENICCSPIQILADVECLMRVRADAKGLAWHVEYDGSIPELIVSDPTRLRQILINLAGNALKFTETGGVRIVTRFVRLDDAPPEIQFDVIDSGIGMTDEQVSCLFRPFTQADASTSRRFGGTGLGLTISKRLAEFLGGTISVSSKQYGGTTFRLTVSTGPLDGVRMVDDPIAITRVKVASAAAKKPVRLTCRVLLAEDGPDNQRLISFLLRKAGAHVTVAENGKDALGKALATFPGWGKRHDDPDQLFDVVLMDMQMPVMDGYDATRRIREEGYTGPIIALTAHAMKGDREKCLAAGCDEYLTKPIDRGKLIDTVKRYSELNAAAPPAEAAVPDPVH